MKEYLVQTKSGSFYPIFIKSGLFEKTSMELSSHGKTYKIVSIGKPKEDPESFIRPLQIESVKPGNSIYYTDPDKPKDLGANTTEIVKVFKRIK